jgi:phosphatidylglycerophosphate synthase
MRSASYRDFLASNRGGGLYSEAVSQRLGSALALAGYRLGLSPSMLSVVHVLIGLSASVAVLLSPSLGVVALLGWQLAYGLDCADGQLARVTGRASPAGARLDVLCDLAVQIGVVTAVASYCPAGTPRWLPAAFAGTWLVNLVTSALQSSGPAAGLLPSRSLAVRILKLARDYGFVILVVGLVLTIRPQWTVALIATLTVFNGTFLLATILRALPGASR